MVGKVKIGKSFTGICRYVFREDKNALVLDAVGVRTENAAEMSQDFEFQRSLRPGLGNAVMHVALALPEQDAKGRSAEEVSDLLRQIALVYLREMKLENTQWALIEHTDKAHPHAHLIVNRVDDNGQTISDNFIGQQSRRVCQGIEQQLQLTVAEQQGRNQAREVGPTHRQATAITPRQIRTADWQRARHEVANALRDATPDSGSFENLQTKMTAKGIDMEQRAHKKEDGPAVYGVVFEKDGFRFKGSEVGKEFSAAGLEKGFTQAREKQATITLREKAYCLQAGLDEVAKLRREADKAEMRGDYDTVGEIRYGSAQKLDEENGKLRTALSSSDYGMALLHSLDAAQPDREAEHIAQELAQDKKERAVKEEEARQRLREEEQARKQEELLAAEQADKATRQAAMYREYQVMVQKQEYERRWGQEVPLINEALAQYKWQVAADDLTACLVVPRANEEQVAAAFQVGIQSWGATLYTDQNPASRPQGCVAIYVKYRPDFAARASDLLDQVRAIGGEVYEHKEHQTRREYLQAQPQPLQRTQQEPSQDTELEM